MSEPMATCCYCGTCSSCTGTAPRPAVADPITFRQAAIKQRMLDSIASVEIDSTRPLGTLGTRDDDDPSIALIDAFAGSMHILAWNIGRLFDDGAIARTEDRDALVSLTRLLGYEPRPAIAATTTLAFTLDTFDASPKVVNVPKGMKVASVPASVTDKPQTFETDAPLEAHVEWNALTPFLNQETVTPITQTTTSLVIAGMAPTAKIGDVVIAYRDQENVFLFGFCDVWVWGRIANIIREPNPTSGPPRTRIDLDVANQSPSEATTGITYPGTVIILGQRAAAFGATAPDISVMPEAIWKIQHAAGGADLTSPPADWYGLVMQAPGAATNHVDLDAIYPDAIAGRLVMFNSGGNAGLIGHIADVSEHARSGFALSAKVTQIGIAGYPMTTIFANEVRSTAIYIETARESLLAADRDEALPSMGAIDRITVTGNVALPVGRTIVLYGETTSAAIGAAPPVGEVATLLSSSSSGGTTDLIFERLIVNTFHSTTLKLFANAISASQGETPASGAEIIGSGDATLPSPRYQLRGSPLAYVPATTPRGYAPAIEVRIGDREYDDVPTIFDLGSEDRAYTVTGVRDGKFEVQFAGRLPTGAHNITALYRTGGGSAGNLTAGRITTAMAPVVGIGPGSAPVAGIGPTGVGNPVPAEGGSEAETIDDMRAAAPKSIRTLDRVVSLEDFEAFAQGYRGVGKALATELHVGMRQVVCVSIATTDLTSPAPGSSIMTALADEFANVTPPGRTTRIAGFTNLTAQVAVALAIDPAYRRSDVEANVRAALGTAFGRGARNFGEALHRSAVLAVVQGVEGVVAATLPMFVLVSGPPENEGRLLCPAPAMTGGVFTQAGLLSLDPGQIRFTEMQP